MLLRRRNKFESVFAHFITIHEQTDRHRKLTYFTERVYACVYTVGRRVARCGHVHISHARFWRTARWPLHAYILHGRRTTLRSPATVLHWVAASPSGYAACDAPVSWSLSVSTEILFSLSLRVHARTQQHAAVGRRRPQRPSTLSTDERPSRTLAPSPHVWSRSKISGALSTSLRRRMIDRRRSFPFWTLPIYYSVTSYW